MIELKGLNGFEIDRVKKAYYQGQKDMIKKCIKAIDEAETPIECHRILKRLEEQTEWQEEDH